ncbi:MAG: bifunctional 5,10-methylenetetrahydrofolate dehydrogenase/5,10-methenyltetrahydrofolate cyclohydrolase [Patescibacteria group bacterium]
MLIDGKAIADTILETLKVDVSHLKTSGITPTLAVILVGDDPASLAYIKQKQKAAEIIGARIILSHQSSSISKDDFKKLILQYNDDPNIHGIIIQRPIPNNLDTTIVKLKKDIDGFLPNSPFKVPVALAVDEILKSIHISLVNKNIVIIGRGETAGKPIAEHLTKMGYAPIIIHSQTPNTKEIMQSADIIISCVGKKRVITSENIKQGVILISVGIWRDTEGKLHGDYDEKDIEIKAPWYTPTPKGVGPVNVACLMQNLIHSCTV